MSVTMIRAQIQEHKVPEAEEAARKMFAEIDQARPSGVRYASSKLPDGVTFVVILQLEEDGDNPLLALQTFRDFQEGLKKWLAEPPSAEPLKIVGSYKLFS
jgi:hypothetical protein